MTWRPARVTQTLSCSCPRYRGPFSFPCSTDVIALLLRGAEPHKLLHCGNMMHGLM